MLKRLLDMIVVVIVGVNRCGDARTILDLIHFAVFFVLILRYAGTNGFFGADIQFGIRNIGRRQIKIGSFPQTTHVLLQQGVPLRVFHQLLTLLLPYHRRIIAGIGTEAEVIQAAHPQFFA